LELSGKKVLVVGLGISGQEAAIFCKKQNAIVTVTDTADEKNLNFSENFLEHTDIKKEIGFHNIKTFKNSDIIIISPGISEKIKPVLAAKEKGVKIIGEIELASRFITVPIIAVTGTNGKSTVTTLIGKMLEESGKKVFIGGNLGKPLISFVNQNKKEFDFIVAEISSFQLDTIETFKPKIGILLNITKDHLDRYENYEEYAKSKFRLFENQDKNNTAILNGEDDIIRSFCKNIKSRKIFFDTNSFKNLEFSKSLDYENAAPAIIAAEIAGADKDSIYSTLKNFKGLPHRIEYVDEIDGVKFYDDSKATNIGSVEYALKKFSAPIILIMGGRDKKGGYSSLKEVIKKHVKKIIVIGEAKGNIYQELQYVTKIDKAASLEEAVYKAHKAAGKNDIVLLSPACSSFDMFKNYKERGDVFVRAVKNLK
jgi:UDP-N-acetylmuramoylalanine--D-glutamate ligase